MLYSTRFRKRCLPFSYFQQLQSNKTEHEHVLCLKNASVIVVCHNLKHSFKKKKPIELIIVKNIITIVPNHVSFVGYSLIRIPVHAPVMIEKNLSCQRKCSTGSSGRFYFTFGNLLDFRRIDLNICLLLFCLNRNQCIQVKRFVVDSITSCEPYTFCESSHVLVPCRFLHFIDS